MPRKCARGKVLFVELTNSKRFLSRCYVSRDVNGLMKSAGTKRVPWLLQSQIVRTCLFCSKRSMMNAVKNELLDVHWIEHAENLSREAVSALTHVDKDGLHRRKACCFCNRLIQCDYEYFMNASELLNDESIKKRLGKDQLAAKLPKSLLEHCTCVGLKKTRTTKELRKLMLSRRTHGVVGKVGKKHEYKLGCCGDCHSQIKVMKENKDHMPLYFIANGLHIGYPPKELSKLNECELAMISLARVSKHLFSYQGGAHKSIKGWHTLHENDIESANGVINYFADRESKEAKDFEARQRSEDDFERTVPQIVVVLTGAFTKDQVAKVQSSFTPRWSLCQKAINWLKENNRLYKNFQLEDSKMLAPIIIDQSTRVDSENSNIEKEFETHCVFPDANQPDEHTNGFESQGEFKRDALTNILSENKNPKLTLLCRSRQTVLKDYLGDALLKAFPLLFPHGYGNDDARDDGRCRSSNENYYRYLMSLSCKNFHAADMCCIVYNMHIRKLMVKNACVKSDDVDRVAIGQLTNEEMEEAALRHVNGVAGSSTADRFIKSTKATANVIPHSAGAARRARQRVFSCVAAFGAPSMMHTVTPEDGYNFRVRVYSLKPGEEFELPDFRAASDEEIFQFSVECQNNRLKYPGLCAFDFEQIIAIVIKYVIGWNVKKQESWKEGGVFGVPKAFCHADEEQGRKTLHAHFLIWIEGFTEMMDIVRNVNHPDHAYWKSQLADYVSMVLDNNLFAKKEEVKCRICKTPLSPCELQQLRTLRYGAGRTYFGVDDNDDLLTYSDRSGTHL